MLVNVWENGVKDNMLTQRQREVEPLSDHVFTYPVPIGGGTLCAWMWIVETHGQYFEMGRVNSYLRLKRMTFDKLIKIYEKRLQNIEVFSNLEIKFAETHSPELGEAVRQSIVNAGINKKNRKAEFKNMMIQRIKNKAERDRRDFELLQSVSNVLRCENLEELSSIQKYILTTQLRSVDEYEINGETVKCSVAELITAFGFDKPLRTDDWYGVKGGLRVAPKRTYYLTNSQGQRIKISGYLGKRLNYTIKSNRRT